MKPLILTGWLMPDFVKDGFADLALDLDFFRFIWGPQPSPDELASYLGPRSPDQQARHTLVGLGWLLATERKQEVTGISAWPNSASNTKPSNCGSTCDPNAQLKLVWLLDYFSSYPESRGQVEAASLSTRR